MKFLYIALLFGCTTIKPVAEPGPTVDYPRQIKDLDFRLLYLEYNQAVKVCFIDLDICRLKKIRESVCWNVHEKCVIDNTNNFNKLLKIRGHD